MAPLNSSNITTETAPLLSNGSSDEPTTQNYNGTAGPKPSIDTNGSVNGQAAPQEEEAVDPAILEARKRMPVIFAGIALGLLMSGMDTSIVNAAYGDIASSFRRLDLAPWVSTGFFLGIGCVGSIYGKLSDIFGRKPCLIFAFSGFRIGSLLCGLAPTMQMFIAARVLQAVGAGGIGVVTTVMLSDIVPIRDRATWQAYINLVFALGGTLGAPLGGFIADRIGWRWNFYLQVPLIAISILNIIVFLRLPKKEISSWRTQVRQIDFSGAFLLVSLIFCLLFGMDRGSQRSFSAPEAWIPLAAFPILLILFVLNEWKFATNPFVPAHAMINRSVLAIYASSFALYGAFASFTFVVPLWFQAIDGVRATQAGLRILPIGVIGVSANLLAGKLLRWTGRYYTIFVLGNLAAAAFMVVVIMATVFPQYDLVLIEVGGALANSGFGMALAASLIALLANITKQDQATLTALLFTMRFVGSAVAISACGTIINSTLERTLLSTLSTKYPDIDSSAVAHGVLESLDYIRGIADPALQQTVREVYAAAVRWAFVLQAGLWGAAGVFAALVRPGRLSL